MNNTYNFLKYSGQMIVPQWVIGCGYITKTLFHLLRLLEGWPGNTILIKLMYAKMQLVSQVHHWHTCWTSPWKKNKRLELYSPGGICHLCLDKWEELQHCSFNGDLKCAGYCEECQLDRQVLEKCGCKKAALYNLLGTDMVGRPAQVFTRYHEKDITRIIFPVYGEKGKLTMVVIGYGANGLYLCCSGDVSSVVNTRWLWIRSRLTKYELQNFQRTL